MENNKKNTECKTAHSLLEEVIETSLFSTRLFSFIAVIASAVGALVMFIKGGFLVWLALENSIKYVCDPSIFEHETKLAPLLISSVDSFLFAMVMMIFSMGIYDLFISKLDPATRTKNSRPNWLNIKNLDDLKDMLGKVILMILIVSFFEYSTTIEFKTAIDLVYFAIGIGIISAALFLKHLSAYFSKEEK